MVALPPELWSCVIHRTASSLSDLARLSALTRATRAMCWTSLSARLQFLNSIRPDGRRPIDIFARDPNVLKNPRAFPDLPEFLALLFSDNDPRKDKRRQYDLEYDEKSDDYDYGYEYGDGLLKEGLLERICSVDGDENEDWVRACIQAWPIDIKGLYAPPNQNSGSHRLLHYASAVVNILCRGRLGALPMMISDVTGRAAMKAVMGGIGVIKIIRDSRDPMPVLVELLDRREIRLHDLHDSPGAIGTAAARGLADVIKFLGGQNPGLGSSPEMWRRIWEVLVHKRLITMNMDVVMALADLGVRINADEILMVLTHPSRDPPQSIEDDSALLYLLDNMYEVDIDVKKARVHHTIYHPRKNVIDGLTLPPRMWVLIDRPRLRQQLIERRILPPELVSLNACLATVVYAGPDAGMVTLARRAVEQGARGTQGGIVNAVDSGNVDLARLVLDATDPRDLARWRDLDVWPRTIAVGDMWRLLVDKGFKVTGKAITRFAFVHSNQHFDDNTTASVLRGMLEAAKPYKHEELRQTGMELYSWCGEEDARLLAIVEVFLDCGYLPSTDEYDFAKECLPKTVRVLDEHLGKNGLSVDDLWRRP